jgi:hypothetical protein
MLLGSKVRPVRGAENLTAIYEPLSGQCGIINISQPYRPSRPVTGISLIFFLLFLFLLYNSVQLGKVFFAMTSN